MKKKLFTVPLLLSLVALSACENGKVNILVFDQSIAKNKISTSMKKTLAITNKSAVKILSKAKNHHEYSVFGLDEDGNSVYGKVVIEGKAGYGSITRIDKSTIEIIAEWLPSKKEIIATDEYGYLYRLTIKKTD